MSDLREALSEIHLIRAYMARCVEFRGYGPTTLAATGMLAMVAASAQDLWIGAHGHDPARYLELWIATAAISLTLIVIETVVRARRIHSSFATQMIQAALEQFLPAIVAGVLLTAC